MRSRRLPQNRYKFTINTITSVTIWRLSHGLVEQERHSVVERLLFLQDAFPYFEKYLVTDYLPKLVERIAFMMKQHQLNTPRDKALLLDYKAELIAWTMDSARQCLASYAIAREKFLNQNAT